MGKGAASCPGDSAVALSLSMLDESLCASALSDGDRIIAVNDQWTRLCGYSNEDAAGHTFKSLLHGPATDRTAAATHAEALGGKPQASVELVNYAKDGRAFTHVLNSRRVTDPATGNHYYITDSYEKAQQQTPKKRKAPIDKPPV